MWHTVQLVALHAVIWTRHKYEKVLETISPAILFLYWPSLIASLFFCVLWPFWLPPAGVAIGALGAVGVLVAIKGEKLHEGHKVIWAFITMMFLVTEVRAIHSDRSEQDRKQLDAVTEIISNGNGGDSICFADVHSSQTIFDQRGKYPLRSVNARIVDQQKLAKFIAQGQSAWNAMQMAQSSVALGDFAVKEGKLWGNLLAVDDQEEKVFNIFYWGLNGSWTQLLRVRHVSGKRTTATKVSRIVDDTRGSIKEVPALEEVDADFPRNAKGEVEWQ